MKTKVWECYETLPEIKMLSDGLLLDGYWDYHNTGFYMIFYDVNEKRLVKYHDTSQQHRLSFLSNLEADDVIQREMYDTLRGQMVIRSDVRTTTGYTKNTNSKVKGRPIGRKIAREMRYFIASQHVPGCLYSIDDEIQLKSKLSDKLQTEISNRLLGEYDEIVELAKLNLPLLNAEVPDIKRVAFDIEVSSPKDKFPVPKIAEFPIHSIALYDSDSTGIVLLLGIKPKKSEKLKAALRLGFEPVIETYFLEEDLHLRFYELIKAYPLIMSYNGDNFDLPYLLHRGIKLGLQPPIFEGHFRGRVKEFQIANTIHIDLFRFFANNAVRLYAYSGSYQTLSLDAVSQALLNANKETHDLWFDEMGNEDLIVYNITDVRLTFDLTKFNDNLTLNLIFMLMRVGRLSLSFVNRESISRWILHWIAFEHERRGYLLPGKNKILGTKGGFRSSSVGGKQYHGAIVLEPSRGVFWDVTVVDFASLYPSVIKKYNLSYETINCLHNVCRLNKVVGLPHWVCNHRVGIMSSLVGFVRDIRVKWYKTRKDQFSKTIQRALKVFINASYGVFGARSFEYFCPPVAESTTAYSRAALLAARQEVNKLGLNVIYGDTDSLFIHQLEEADYRSLKLWSVVKLGIELGIDYKFRFVVMSGRKKNYFGITTDGELILKGLVVKKRNTATYIQDSFNMVAERFKKVNGKTDLEEALDDVKLIIRDRAMKLRNGEVKLSELSRIATLNRALHEYSVNTPAVQVAVQKMIDGNSEIQQGTQFSIITTQPFKVVVRTDAFTHLRKGSEIQCRVKEMDSVTRSQVDHESYLKNMRKAFEPILESFDIQWSEIFAQGIAIDEYF